MKKGCRRTVFSPFCSNLFPFRQIPETLRVFSGSPESIRLTIHFNSLLYYSAVMYFATISSSFPDSSRFAMDALIASRSSVLPFLTAIAYSSSAYGVSRSFKPSFSSTNTCAGLLSMITASILPVDSACTASAPLENLCTLSSPKSSVE